VVDRLITQLLLEADHSTTRPTRLTQLLLEVDTRPPAVIRACYIVELTQTKDGYERISRVYPYGGGVGMDRVTLASATVSAAAGYTMDTTNNYLEYDAAPSRVDAVVTWGDIGNQDDENATDAGASNTLYYAAYNHLRKRIAANETYSIRVVGLDDPVSPGDTVRVQYRRYVDGVLAIDIDDSDLCVLESSTEIDDRGVRTVAMQLATVDMWPASDANMVVDMQRRITSLEKGGASLGIGRVSGGDGTSSDPGSLSATTTNETSDGIHTHAIDTTIARLTAGTESRLPSFDAAGTTIEDSAIADGVSGDVLTISATLTAARAFTLPDAAMTITGGGTLALGGYTLTAPATGTAALATGLAGGQTVYGGTAADDDLTLESTSNATKGYLLLQPNGGNVGVGMDTPTEQLQIKTGEKILLIESGVTENRIAGSGMVLKNIYTLGVWARSLFSYTDDDDAAYFSLGALGNAQTFTRAFLGPAYNNTWQTWNSTQVIINEEGADSDFRVESDTNAYAFFLEGSSGKIGIATGGPTAPVDLRTAAGFTRAMRIGPATTTLDDGAYIEFTSSSLDAYGAQIGGIRDGASGSNALVFRTGTNSQAERMRITNAGRVGVMVTAPGAQLHVDQASTTGAIPVLTLDQADVSEEFMRLVGASAADDSQSLIDAADMTTPGAIVGWIKVYVEDVAASGAITDGTYFVPFYAAPTA